MTGIQAASHRSEPVNDPHSHGDVYTGMETASAVLAALFQRERTGSGQFIEVSMAQTMLYVNEHAQLELFDGSLPDDQVLSFQPGDYPILRTRDGRDCVISGHPAERGTFDLFATAMGRPELVEDSRFVDVASRLRNIDDLLVIMKQWASTVETAEQLEAIASEVGLAMGVLRTMDELVSTEWGHERNVVVRADDRSGGSFRVPNSPWVFSGSDTGTRGVPKFRGEDNAAVLTGILGFSAEEVSALLASGVLSQRLPRA